MDFLIRYRLCHLVFQILLTFCVDGAKTRTWEGKLVFQEDFTGDVLNANKWEKIGSCEGAVILCIKIYTFFKQRFSNKIKLLGSALL